MDEDRIAPFDFVTQRKAKMFFGEHPINLTQGLQDPAYTKKIADQVADRDLPKD